jgi:hypothetical protein
MRQTVIGRKERLQQKPDAAAAPQRKRGARSRERAIDARINRLYGQRCSGWQIDIMDIPKIFAAGRTTVNINPDITDEQLGDAIQYFTQQLRKD